MKTTLVTGADGFIGSHLTEQLVRPLNTYGSQKSEVDRLFW